MDAVSDPRWLLQSNDQLQRERSCVIHDLSVPSPHQSGRDGCGAALCKVRAAHPAAGASSGE